MRIYACVRMFSLMRAIYYIRLLVSLSLSLSLSNKISELTNTFVLIISTDEEYFCSKEYIIIKEKLSQSFRDSR